MSIRYAHVVMGDRRVKGGTKMVLVALAWRANKSGVCWPSEQTIATDSGLSRRQVRSAIAKLAASGMISVEKRRGGRNTYRICVASPTGGCGGQRRRPAVRRRRTKQLNLFDPSPRAVPVGVEPAQQQQPVRNPAPERAPETQTHPGNNCPPPHPPILKENLIRSSDLRGRIERNMVRRFERREQREEAASIGEILGARNEWLEAGTADRYSLIAASPDPIDACAIATGLTDARNRDVWSGFISKIMAKMGRVAAERAVRSAASSVWGQIKAGEVRNPGAAMTMALKGLCDERAHPSFARLVLRELPAPAAREPIAPPVSLPLPLIIEGAGYRRPVLGESIFSSRS